MRNIQLKITLFFLWTDYYSGSLSQYKTFIRGLLFTHYSRKATQDSSGFEHVFVGEFSDSSTISGFHNWVRMYLLEDQGHANYYGYIKQKQVDRFWGMAWWGINLRYVYLLVRRTCSWEKGLLLFYYRRRVDIRCSGDLSDLKRTVPLFFSRPPCFSYFPGGRYRQLAWTTI